MKKIGILGGTFDPIHIAHLLAADQAIFYADLDEIWFMPAPIPPHKRYSKVTPIVHRVEMVKRVTALNSKYKLCTIELEREGPSYTFDTMKEIKKRFPEDSFFFIIGGDMVHDLSDWYKIEELLQMVRFIGLERPGYLFEPGTETEKGIYEQVVKIPMPHLDISSSLIREWIKMGRTICYVVPSSVEEYIKENHLYEY